MCKVGTEYGIYVDGVQLGHDSSSYTNTLNGDLFIGRRGDSSNYLTGWMDEIRIIHSNYFNASPNSGLTDTITVPTSAYAKDTWFPQKTEYTRDVTIAVADTWQEISLDMSGITDENKDTITDFGIRITDADEENEIYLDIFDARYVGVRDIDNLDVYDASVIVEDVTLAQEPALDIGALGTLFESVTLVEDDTVSKSQPVTPTNTSPTNGSINEPLQATLQGSTYSHPFGISHDRTRWQVTDTSGVYTTPVYDSGWVAGAPTSHLIPSGTLDPETTYYWRLSYRDVEYAWSEWSSETYFTTKTLLIGGKVTLNSVGVSGAKVYCVKQTTNAVVGTDTSDGNGDYSFYPLELGEKYHLTVEYENGGTLYNSLNKWDVDPVETDVP
jgi:hypothetical protein